MIKFILWVLWWMWMCRGGNRNNLGVSMLLRSGDSRLEGARQSPGEVRWSYSEARGEDGQGLRSTRWEGLSSWTGVHRSELGETFEKLHKYHVSTLIFVFGFNVFESDNHISFHREREQLYVCLQRRYSCYWKWGGLLQWEEMQQEGLPDRMCSNLQGGHGGGLWPCLGVLIRWNV